MLPVRLRYALLFAVVLFFIIVLSLLKRKRLALKYTLLWLLTVVVLFVLTLWPELLLVLADLVGIQTGMNALYVFLIAFILMILMSITSIVSAQTERIRKLVEANAILERRVRELEADHSRACGDSSVQSEANQSRTKRRGTDDIDY